VTEFDDGCLVWEYSTAYFDGPEAAHTRHSNQRQEAPPIESPVRHGFDGLRFIPFIHCENKFSHGCNLKASQFSPPGCCLAGPFGAC